MHSCGVCFMDSDVHLEECDGTPDQPLNVHQHWPALCCPGCRCESFEQAHPVAEHINTAGGAT